MKRSFRAKPGDFLSLTQLLEQMFPVGFPQTPTPCNPHQSPAPQPRSLPPGRVSQTGRSLELKAQRWGWLLPCEHSNLHPSTLECSRGPAQRVSPAPAWKSKYLTSASWICMLVEGMFCVLPPSPDQEMPRVLFSATLSSTL